MPPRTLPPWAIDPAKIDHRAVRLVAAFKDAVARMHAEHGLTFDDIGYVLDFLLETREVTGITLAMAAQPLFGDVFQDGGRGYTVSEEVDSPTYLPGSPLIDNPGRLPMRPDEPGVPLIASGRVLDGHGDPLAGAEMVIYHAGDDGTYSGFGTSTQPPYHLRGRQLTDDEGRYRFTTITPVPYSEVPPPLVERVSAAAAALGRSTYRPAHIHFEIHHPDLLKPYRGEIYFAGDPVIPLDIIGPYVVPPSAQADLVLHDDPEDIAAHGFDRPFHTAVFDFVLKTRTSPDTAVGAPA
ncbi:MAG TPA: hypothetical protein VKZ81_04990 [Pseudonocardia sp.]|uniref:dioxygenase family protein n=1 Tax=Pseudonocardia sp. TaxID=60912 RepID=UPI002B4B55C3|nr:hypothetical protein [Pseudonocardia sp.]HLU54796.1 hypothetical protein [Pseudonocardia sp.]